MNTGNNDLIIFIVTIIIILLIFFIRNLLEKIDLHKESSALVNYYNYINKNNLMEGYLYLSDKTDLTAESLSFYSVYKKGGNIITLEGEKFIVIIYWPSKIKFDNSGFSIGKFNMIEIYNKKDKSTLEYLIIGSTLMTSLRCFNGECIKKNIEIKKSELNFEFFQ